MQRQARLFVVTDYPIVRFGLQRLIEGETEFRFTGAAADTQEAWSTIQEEQPDLVIVDVAVDSYRGLDLLGQIAELDGVQTLVFSRHTEPSYVEHALRVGARGYLTYHDPTARIVEAIRQVLEGECFLSATLKRREEHSKAPTVVIVDAAASETLTEREQQVLELMGEGLPRRNIAERLDLSPKTIDAHRENIKRKLKLPGMAALSRYAVQWARKQTDKQEGLSGLVSTSNDSRN